MQQGGGCQPVRQCVNLCADAASGFRSQAEELRKAQTLLEREVVLLPVVAGLPPPVAWAQWPSARFFNTYAPANAEDLCLSEDT